MEKPSLVEIIIGIAMFLVLGGGLAFAALVVGVLIKLFMNL